jgi:hypothetical protein
MQSVFRFQLDSDNSFITWVVHMKFCVKFGHSTLTNFV